MMLEKVTGPECPECGCTASRVVAERAGRSGNWERRECSNCGFEFATRVGDADEPPVGLVRYVPVICPICDSRNTIVSSTRGRIRHHICRACRRRFKTVEMQDGEAQSPGRSLRRGKVKGGE